MNSLDFKIKSLSQHLTDDRIDRILSVSSNRTKYLTVVLENVYYTQNVSAIVRTCECLGIAEVYKIGQGEQGSLNKHVARGSSAWIDVKKKTLTPVKEMLTELKVKGYRIFCAMPSPTAKSIFDVDLEKGPIALVMGNERDGASAEAVSMADELITIPMYGFTESFNISVSTAIILSEFIHRLNCSSIVWKLSEEEKKLLVYDWIKKSLKHSDDIEKEHERRLSHPNEQ